MSTEIIAALAAVATLVTEEVDTLGFSVKVAGRPKTSEDLNALNRHINPTDTSDLARDEACSNLDYRGYYPSLHRGLAEKLQAKFNFARLTKTTPKKGGGESVTFDETVAKYVARGVADGAFTLEDARRAAQEWADANPWATIVLTGTTRTSAKFPKEIETKADDVLAKIATGALPVDTLEAKIGSFVEGFAFDLDDTGTPTKVSVCRGLLAMQKALMAQAGI